MAGDGEGNQRPTAHAHTHELCDACRAEAEERLLTELRAKRFAALVENSRDFLAMASLTGEILFVNKAGRELLGIQDFDGLPLERFHTEEGMKRAAIIREKGWWEGEGELRHFRTGELIPTQITSFLLRDPDGTPVGFATVQRDLRPARQLDKHVLQAQKLETTGRLAAGVVHDFNNMLSVILGYGALIRRSLPEESALRGEVDEMLGAARRAGQLTKQLLVFSRPQSEESSVVSLNEVVTGIDGMARRLVGSTVTVVANLDPAAGWVQVDVGQIEQVILNIVTNARDAMPKGGTLTMATSQVVIGGEPGAEGALPTGRYAVLRVTDTGSGMDEATMQRVFEPFFTTKAPGAGTGLGLSTVLGVVKQSGGHVAVQSRPGQGTTFSIFLPAAPAPSSRLQPAAPRYVPPSSS
jgi:PAS domain S-box-containing protein